MKYVGKGDKVLCDLNGSTASVICVMVMRIPCGHIPMIEFPSGLQITPQHPIFLNEKWVKPQDIGHIKRVEYKYVYNILLDRTGIIIVNAITCVALRHGINGEVQHEFWGNRDTIVNAFCHIDKSQFEEGRILVSGWPGMQKRDESLGLEGAGRKANVMESLIGISIQL